MNARLDPSGVIREHAAFVWRVLQHMGAHESELDDLCQEALVIVLRQLPSFEGRSSLRTWIYGICRNVAQRARAERGKARELAVPKLPERGAPATQDHALWLKQAYARLVEALDTLDADQRTVFVLYEIEELTMEEIAEAVTAPVTTCYSRLHAARAKIEALLRKGEQRVTFQMMRGGMR
jgi:RNA polymerase sigma-70 factor (ECF subfamily)